MSERVELRHGAAAHEVVVATHHPGRGRGVVVCGHAMMCNARTFERVVAPRLCAAGFDVYTVDLPGHGASRKKGEPSGGAWGYDELVLSIWPGVVAAVRARHPALPVAVVGHSLCGHGSLAWLGQEEDGGVSKIDAMVAVGANVWMRQLEPSLLRWLKKRGVLLAWHAAARLVRGNFPARRLRIGPEDAPAPFVDDFIRFAATGRYETQGGRDYLAGLPRVAVPVLALLGEADALLCAPASGRAFAARLRGAPRVDVWEIATSDYPGLVPDHMRLVTDPNAAPLWDRVASWLDAALPRRVG